MHRIITAVILASFALATTAPESKAQLTKDTVSTALQLPSSPAIAETAPTSNAAVILASFALATTAPQPKAQSTKDTVSPGLPSSPAIVETAPASKHVFRNDSAFVVHVRFDNVDEARVTPNASYTCVKRNPGDQVTYRVYTDVGGQRGHEIASSKISLWDCLDGASERTFDGRRLK
jgi:hypothetical protein